MSNGKKTYTVIDKGGNEHTVKGDFMKRDENGFVVIVYADGSGCVSEYHDIEKGAFHEPASVTFV